MKTFMATLATLTAINLNLDRFPAGTDWIFNVLLSAGFIMAVMQDVKELRK